MPQIPDQVVPDDESTQAIIDRDNGRRLEAVDQGADGHARKDGGKL